MTTTKTYELHLGYFKQGDDMATCLEATGGSTEKALTARADELAESVRRLRALAVIAAKNPEFTISTADTHMVAVECPADLGDMLVKEKLLSESLFEDEEDYGEEDCVAVSSAEVDSDDVEPSAPIPTKMYKIPVEFDIGHYLDRGESSEMTLVFNAVWLHQQANHLEELAAVAKARPDFKILKRTDEGYLSVMCPVDIGDALVAADIFDAVEGA